VKETTQDRRGSKRHSSQGTKEKKKKTRKKKRRRRQCLKRWGGGVHCQRNGEKSVRREEETELIVQGARTLVLRGTWPEKQNFL